VPGAAEAGRSTCNRRVGLKDADQHHAAIGCGAAVLQNCNARRVAGHHPAGWRPCPVPASCWTDDSERIGAVLGGKDRGNAGQ